MTDGSIHIFVGCNSQHHTDITEECRDNHTLDDNQLQDAPGLGTYCLADAKLVGALFDGDKHDVAHTYNTGKQREQSYHPQGCAYDTYTGLHLQILGVAIPYPDSIFIIGMCLVVGI